METVVLAIVFAGGWIVISLAFIFILVRRKEIAHRKSRDGAAARLKTVYAFVEDETGDHTDDGVMG